jgi:hypothetical protein
MSVMEQDVRPTGHDYFLYRFYKPSNVMTAW